MKPFSIKSLRVLINMPSQFGGMPSGVARMAFMIMAQMLKSTDFTFVLRSPWTKEQLPDFLITSRVSVITIKRPKFLVFDVPFQGLIMPGIVRKHMADVVLNMDPFGSPFNGCPTLSIIHDLYFKTIPDQFSKRAIATNNFLLDKITRGSQTILTISETTKRDIEKFYPGLRVPIVNIANAMTVTYDGKIQVPEAKDKYILLVGNATSNKNFVVVAKALKQLIARGDEATLIYYVGKDDKESIAAELGPKLAATRLRRFRGIDDQALAGLYANAFCLCVPSLYEGFCMPLIEAQTLSCPVVTSSQSVMPEVAGDAALYFDPHSIDDLAQNLEKLSNTEGLRADLIARGHVNAKRFSWERTAGLVEAELRRMIREPAL